LDGSFVHVEFKQPIAGTGKFGVYAAPSVPDGWRGLTDVEWMNIVNFDRAYSSYDKEGAVNEAVKRTEAKLKELNAAQQQEPPADLVRDAEPVAYVTGVYGGHTTVAPIDAAQVLRVGVALYTAPPAPSVPLVRSTGQWESSRIADYNRGWNDCREATEKALNDLEKRK
jgi:hypothetical protein